MFGIITPVCRDVERSTRLKPTGRKFKEGGLQDPALVMSFLGPRVGKKEVDALERPFGDLVSQDLDRVVPDDAQIGNAGPPSQNQAMANAWFMHFDTDEILARVPGGSVN